MQPESLILSDLLTELAKNGAERDFESDAQWRAMLELTFAVWRVAEAAVKDDMLKVKIKQTALDMLLEFPQAVLNEAKSRAFAEQSKKQRALLSLAQRASNASEVNFVVLKDEYRKMETFLEASRSAKKQTPQQEPVPQAAEIKQPDPVVPELSDRQQKIMQFFNRHKGENVKLNQVMHVFPDLTGRTIRNDLRELCMKKLMVRSDGHGQASFYKLVYAEK